MNINIKPAYLVLLFSTLLSYHAMAQESITGKYVENDSMRGKGYYTGISLRADDHATLYASVITGIQVVFGNWKLSGDTVLFQPKGTIYMKKSAFVPAWEQTPMKFLLKGNCLINVGWPYAYFCKKDE
jgi:hypothetical protein